MLEKLFQKDEKLLFIFYDFFKVGVFFISLLISYNLRFTNFSNFSQYLNFTIVFSIISFFLSSYFRKEFFFDKNIYSNFKIDIIYLFITVIISLLILYLFKISSNYSRIWLVSFFICNLLLLLPYKLLANIFYEKIIKSNIFLKNVLIIGEYQDCKKILTDFKDKHHYNFRAMSLLNKSKNINHLPIQEIKLDQDVFKMLKFNNISQIWLIYNFNFDRDNILEKFSTIPIDIRTIIPKSMNDDIFIDTYNGYSFYNTSFSPFYGFRYFIKLIIDIFLSLLFLIISSPFIILASICIIIEDGFPFIYIQKRYGWDGKIINIYKLRSLKKNNDSFLQVTKNDNRVLKVGKIIRKLSIDELPQFVNILKGEMSLVGPRPHPIELDDEFSKKIRGFMQRLRCKPGLTGLAQVKGFRGPTTDNKLMQLRYENDLMYIKKWSLRLDILIILKTLAVFLFQKVD